MLHVKTIDGAVVTYPYDIGMLRQDNPDTSFPVDMPDERLAEYGVYAVTSVLQPVVDYTQNVVEGLPENLNGVWTQKWDVTPASQAEIDSRTIAKSGQVRAQRNKMLSECDWTQLADSTVVDKAAWAQYRQGLRDLTKQAGFPWAVVWPVSP